MGTAEQREGVIKAVPWQGADGVARRDPEESQHGSRAQQKRVRADKVQALHPL